MKNGKTMLIQTLWRVFDDGEIEELHFQPGINVIVGPPNTGKTKWLRTLDYLFGDPDTPEKTLGTDITERYCAAGVSLLIGDKEIIIERRWKEAGKRTKVFVNDIEITASELSGLLLDELDIPIIEYPRSNAADENNWVNLTWRSLLRHIYRREKFWSDIANEQPRLEQHACLMQFLGLAEHLFRSQSSKELSLLHKEKEKLSLRKDQFMEVLRDLSSGIISKPEFGEYLTKTSVDSAILDIQGEIEKLLAERESILKSMPNQTSSDSQDVVKELGSKWSQLYELRDSKEKERIALTNRITELEKYQRTLSQELERMSRARVAGVLLSDFKVTQCPVCDQDVEANDYSNPDDCYLCHRPYKADKAEFQQRIDFEIHQLKEQNSEIDQLIQKLKRDENNLNSEVQKIHREVYQIEISLRSVRTAAAAVLPPEIGIIDQKIGASQEKISQLKSVNNSLERRDSLNKEIDDLEKQIQKIRAEITTDKSNANFAQSSQDLEEGMNVYLRALASQNMLDKWNQGSVKVRIDDRSFNFIVGDSFWDSKLGFTYMADFLMSYHYALLRLSHRSDYNYPGLTILDFPINTPGENFVSKEAYLIQPFQKIVQGIKVVKVQVIATGRSFHGLEDANRIELTEVYQPVENH